MLALAGYPLGLHFRFLDPSPEAPVGRIAQRVTAEYSDHSALEKFSNGLELVTYEFENVPVGAARFLAQRVPVYPPPAALEAAQDRLAEKDLFRKLGIATTDRKSTRLNSSHLVISYAVFCLKKKTDPIRHHLQSFPRYTPCSGYS